MTTGCPHSHPRSRFPPVCRLQPESPQESHALPCHPFSPPLHGPGPGSHTGPGGLRALIMPNRMKHGSLCQTYSWELIGSRCAQRLFRNEDRKRVKSTHLAEPVRSRRPSSESTSREAVSDGAGRLFPYRRPQLARACRPLPVQTGGRVRSARRWRSPRETGRWRLPRAQALPSHPQGRTRGEGEGRRHWEADRSCPAPACEWSRLRPGS